MAFSYAEGQFVPTNLDLELLQKVEKADNLSEFPHLWRWFTHIQTFDQAEKCNFVQIKASNRVRKGCKLFFLEL